MREVLVRMEFGKVFLKWVGLLYDHPIAAIKLRVRISEFCFLLVEALGRVAACHQGVTLL